MPQVEHAAVAQSRAKFEKTIASRWGLSKCPDIADCRFCALVDGDAIAQYRNLYIAGLPTDVIAPLLGDAALELSKYDLENHGFRQHWDRKRASIKQMQVTPELATHMILRRYVGGLNFYSPNSSDKMVEAMMKMVGVGQNVNVAVSGGLSWEQVVTKRRAAPADTATVITVADDDFVEVPNEPLALEDGSDAASD